MLQECHKCCKIQHVLLIGWLFSYFLFCHRILLTHIQILQVNCSIKKIFLWTLSRDTYTFFNCANDFLTFTRLLKFTKQLFIEMSCYNASKMCLPIPIFWIMVAKMVTASDVTGELFDIFLS